MANYISCKGCGMTYLETADRKCPHCGAREERSGKGFDLDEMRFSFDQIPLKNIAVMLVTVLVLAVLNIIYSVNINRGVSEIRDVYEQAAEVVHSGQYAEALREYNEMKVQIENGYRFSDEQMQRFREVEDAISRLPDDIYTVMAQAEGSLKYMDLLVVVNVIIGVMYIIAGVLVLLRFRMSFRVMLGALALGVAGLVVFELWGVAMGYKDLSITRIVYYIIFCVPIIKECIGCDALVYRSAERAPASSSVVGASMPKVQELYSFEDMPELSGMKGLNDAQPLETQDAQDEDDVMDSVTPVGVANTTAEKPMFRPSEVAPDVEPVVPLTNYHVGDSVTDEGENIAITPLQRPMFEVDMMEDEAMPAIGGVEETQPAAAQPEPAVFQPEPVQVPVSAKGIWFCPVCGSLNENTLICDTCGANKQ